jgi:hypothetical protein
MIKHLLIFTLLCASASSSFAQPSPVTADVVYKEWQVLPNSKNMVEIFYSIVKCGNENKINLMIFNDSSSDQDIQFALDIINIADNQHFTVTKNFSAKKGVFHKAVCGNDALPDLKISLPDTYTPLGISIKQTL